MESTKGGFITVYRKILDWEWYDDIPTYRLFTHLLYTVNWKEGEWHGIAIHRGQRIVSIQKLADETSLSVQQVRTALSHLEMTGEVRRDVLSIKSGTSTNRVSLVTVANYEVYQSVGRQPTEQQQTSNRATTDLQQTSNRATTEQQHIYNNITIDNKGNKEKEGEESNKGRAGASPSFPKSIDDGLAEYKEALREVGKPVSYAGLRRIGDKLMKLATDSDGVIDEEKAKAILDQSIIHSWRDVYPLDEDKDEEAQEGDEDIDKWLRGEGFEDPFAQGRYDV